MSLLLVEVLKLGQQNSKPVRLVTFDLDGVVVEGPASAKTALELFSRTYSPPKLGKKFTPYKPNHSLVDFVVARFVTPHEKRNTAPGAVEGLREFREVAKYQQLEIVHGVLSGRDLPLHEVTKQWLQKTGLLGDLLEEDEISLNTGRSSSLWKELITYRGAARFYSVAHVDDDLPAAQRVGQVNGELIPMGDGKFKKAKVLSFLIRNWSNNPWLLRWAGVELAENVVPVRSISEAAKQYEQRLLNGEI